MGKILLYYKYIAIQYPHQILKWQQKICADLGLKGRIILAHEGINGTIGGAAEQVERYKKIMRKHPLFADLVFKESSGTAEQFPRMRIVVKKEIVNSGLPETITAANGGRHLSPEQTHALIATHAKDLVLLDARNNFESRVGTFQNALTPNIDYFRELPAYIDNNLEQFKDKDVLMFCTGGIRCERASAYLKSKNVAKNVYQIDGGIHTYTEKFPDGFFRGKNYVFDGRLTMQVNRDILGNCALCATHCDDYTNCRNASCNNHFICCPPCLDQLQNCCSRACVDLLATNQVAPRPPRLNHKNPVTCTT